MGVTDSAAEMLGVTEKAIIEIADTSGRQPQFAAAPKPDAGAGTMAGKGDFNTDNVKQAMGNAGVEVEYEEGHVGQQGFEDFGKLQRYRYNVLFNPEEINVTGYGGEEMPTQDFRQVPPRPGDNPEPPPQDGEGGGHHHHHGPHHGFPGPSSRMASSNTRIDFSVKFVIDRTDNSEAFFEDKFTLSQTTIAKNAAKTAMGKDKVNTVQADVEALSAVARDRHKRLARFVWGDMIYEGMITSVNAEYVMFNMNGEPCRAYVTLNMVLFDNDEMPSSKTMWQSRYIESFLPQGRASGQHIAENL